MEADAVNNQTQDSQERAPQMTLVDRLDRLKLGDLHRRPRYWYRMLQAAMLVICLTLLVGCFANVPQVDLSSDAVALASINSALSYVAFALGTSTMICIGSLLIDVTQGSMKLFLSQVACDLILGIAWAVQFAISAQAACKAGPIDDAQSLLDKHIALCSVSHALAAFILLTWLTFLLTTFWSFQYSRSPKPLEETAAPASV